MSAPQPPNIMAFLQEAQKLQERMKNVQKELAHKTVRATSGGGMVEVSANGKQEILSIAIDDTLWGLHDRDLLQDLVRSAVNEALVRASALQKEALGEASSGFPIPDLGNLFS